MLRRERERRREKKQTRKQKQKAGKKMHHAYYALGSARLYYIMQSKTVLPNIHALVVLAELKALRLMHIEKDER